MGTLSVLVYDVVNSKDISCNSAITDQDLYAHKGVQCSLSWNTKECKVPNYILDPGHRST